MSTTAKCPQCGADVDYSPGKGELSCPYCGKQTAIKEKINPQSIAADCIIPTQLDKTRLRRQTQAYMVSGPYTPDDIVDQSEIVTEEIVYHPAYLSSGSFTANWTASFGYKRQETYQEWYSPPEGGRKLATKTRTVTDWRPANGVATGSFAVLAYAGNRIKYQNVVSEILESAPRNRIKVMDSSYTAGCGVESFAVEAESTAVEDKFSAKISAVIEKAVKKHKQGDEAKDWRWNSQLDRKRILSILIPLGHSVFTYSGKDYDVYVPALEGSHVIGTELPKDKTRRYKAWLGFLPALIAVLAFVVFACFASSVGYGFSWKACAAVLGCLIMGFSRRSMFINYSTRVRNSKLAQQQISTTNIDATSEKHQALLKQAEIPVPSRFMKFSWDAALLLAFTLMAVTVIFHSGLK